MADVVGDAIIRVVIDTSKGDDPTKRRRRKRKTDEAGEASPGGKSEGDGSGTKPENKSPKGQSEDAEETRAGLKSSPQAVRELLEALMRRFGTPMPRAFRLFEYVRRSNKREKAKTAKAQSKADREATRAESKRTESPPVAVPGPTLPSPAPTPAATPKAVPGVAVIPVAPAATPNVGAGAVGNAAIIAVVIAAAVEASQFAFTIQPRLEGAVAGALGLGNDSSVYLPVLNEAAQIGRGIGFLKDKFDVTRKELELEFRIAGVQQRFGRVVSQAVSDLDTFADVATDVEFQRSRFDLNFGRKLGQLEGQGIMQGILQRSVASTIGGQGQ